jgi:hypothetical protein
MGSLAVQTVVSVLAVVELEQILVEKCCIA